MLPAYEDSGNCWIPERGLDVVLLVSWFADAGRCKPKKVVIVTMLRESLMFLEIVTGCKLYAWPDE